MLRCLCSFHFHWQVPESRQKRCCNCGFTAIWIYKAVSMKEHRRLLGGACRSPEPLGPMTAAISPGLKKPDTPCRMFSLLRLFLRSLTT